MCYEQLLFEASQVLFRAGRSLTDKELLYKIHVADTDRRCFYQVVGKLKHLPYIIVSSNGKLQWNPDYGFVTVRMERGIESCRCSISGVPYFIKVPSAWMPMDKDVCVVRIVNRFNMTAELVRILKRNNRQLDCVVEQSRNQLFGNPVDKYRDPFSVLLDDNGHYAAGAHVRVSLDPWTVDLHPKAEFVYVLDEAGDFSDDFANIILRKYGVARSFSPGNNAVGEEEDVELPTLTSKIKQLFQDRRSEQMLCIGRKDVGYILTETEYSYILDVYIAHVPYYIRFGSPEDKTCRKVGETCRLRDRTIPVISPDTPYTDLTGDGFHLCVCIRVELGPTGVILSADGCECITQPANWIAANELDGFSAVYTDAFAALHPDILDAVMSAVELRRILTRKYSNRYFIEPFDEFCYVADKAVQKILDDVDFPFIAYTDEYPDDIDVGLCNPQRNNLVNTIWFQTKRTYRVESPQHMMGKIGVTDVSNSYVDILNLGLLVRWFRHTLIRDDAEDNWYAAAKSIAAEMTSRSSKNRAAAREYARRMDDAHRIAIGLSSSQNAEIM